MISSVALIVLQVPNHKDSEQAVQSIIGEVFGGVSFEEFEVSSCSTITVSLVASLVASLCNQSQVLHKELCFL